MALHQLLDGLLVDFQIGASARHVTLDALVFGGALEVDAGVVRPLLTSLLDQALRRAPRGTSVTVVVSPRHGYTEIRIADEGSQKEHVPGEGQRQNALDLRQSIRAAEAAGGRLWLPETANGTVVCLALPGGIAHDRAGPARKRSDTQLKATRVGPESTSRTIMVVDDEPLMRTFVSRALKDNGYGVIEADCAERAMDRLVLRPPSLALLLSDVGLPDTSGAELVRQARLLHPGLPTLLMSGTSKQSLVQDGVIRAGTELLAKPFSIAELLAAVERLLHSSTSLAACAR
jgi:CheY-like chemotaxis protein